MAIVRTNNQYYSDIASAIRRKLSASTQYLPSEMASAIMSISSGGGGGSDDNFKIAMGAISGSIYDAELSYVRAYAFYNNNYLTGVKMLNVGYIGPYAFLNCGNLEYASFPICSQVGARAIGGAVFSSCIKLKEVHLPQCTLIEGNDAFKNCSTLSTIDIPLLENVPSSAFNNCIALENISLPNATVIYNNAFQGCTALTNVSFPMCSTISASAFRNCTALTNVSFPMCSTIGSQAFLQCSALTSISFPMCSNIEVSAFTECPALTSISFPMCSSIGASAFKNCQSLTNASFPMCSSIGYEAFKNCQSLTNVSFPMCSTIGAFAFQNCTALTNVSFPMCTTIGGQGAFSNCINLSAIYLLGSSVASLGNINAFNNTPIANSSYLGYFGSIYVPSSLVDSYKSASNWSQYADRITSYVEV